MKMNKVTISQTKDMLKALIGNAFSTKASPENIMIGGSPGVGKSSIVFQVAKELEEEFDIEIEVIDVRLSCMEASDVQGIPHNADTGEFYESPNGTVVPKKEMITSTPHWFPTNPNKFYILFFDEITNSSVSVQHAAYRILLDRSIQNGNKLPDTCAIVAAGNLKEDKTGAKPMLPAAANRFGVHLEIDKDRLLESFVAYAMNNNFHRSIVGYLQWKPTSLFDISTGDTGGAFATPRSWEFVNNHMKNPRLYEALLDMAIAGAIGTGVAVDFAGFREYEGLLPDFTKIRSGEETYEFPMGEEGIKFAVTTALSYEILDILGMENVNAAKVEMDNLVNIIKGVPVEMLIVMFRSLSVDKSKMVKIFSFPSLRAEYSKVSKFLTALK